MSTSAGSASGVTLHFWAAAREAAGTAEESVQAETLSEALTAAVSSRGTDGARLALVFKRCSFLIDGDPVGLRDPASVHLKPGTVVEILPPFAGG